MSWKGQRGDSTMATEQPFQQDVSAHQVGEQGPIPMQGLAHPVDAYSNPSYTAPAPVHVASPSPPANMTRHDPAGYQGGAHDMSEQHTNLTPPPTVSSPQSSTDPRASVGTDYRALPPLPPRPAAGAQPLANPYGQQIPSMYGHPGYQPSPYGNQPQPPPVVSPYGPGVWHDGGKIVGGPTTGIGIRYGLMATHFILLVVTTVISTYYVRDIVNLILHLSAALAFLIYIPAAFGITVARRRNHYDHAAGELSYLVVQMCLWLGSGIWSTIYLVLSDCSARRRVYNTATRSYVWVSIFDRVCRFGAAISGLSFAHFLILLGWMIWVIVLVYRATPGDPGRGFQVSTAWLLRGWNRGS